MHKILIISHIADIDGLGSVVLSKIIFKNIDYILVELPDLQKTIKDLIDTNKYKEYEEIFITDLSINNDLIKLIQDHNDLKIKIKHFDHHESEVENNSIDFINEVPIKNGILTCGTALFYDYLKENYKDSFLYNNATIRFVEGTRSRDTWDFKNNGNKDANKLEIVHSYYGNEYYINKYIDVLKNDLELFNEGDNILIKRNEEEQEYYIKECDKKLIIFDLDGYKVGCVIAESYRSEVGNVLSSNHPELDYILIVNFFRNSFSFRTPKDNVAVSLIISIMNQPHLTYLMFFVYPGMNYKQDNDYSSAIYHSKMIKIFGVSLAYTLSVIHLCFVYDSKYQLIFLQECL